ncbi:hypothetical protein CVIRNUC_008557 [Coccomyxa viridis]|uniref:Uncharacterized protein n=1 Tax=Coccomyxa viridis TaxID=1274662 RepID=A0AAV1IFW1_9CHLO|nr:hypothetical protein CVIRNUC_008557 [Coccomyxa viridis]
MFKGLSTLRKHERKAAANTEESKKLQAYLSKYTSSNGDDGSEKKRRKKKKVGGPTAGLRIVDEDATGFRTGPAARMQGDDDDAEDEDEDGPVIANPGEAELARKLIERERAGLEAQGWSAVGGEARNGSSAAQQDASPPRRKRQRHDSPDTSPPRRQRHDTPDASPPRLQQQGSPDASPPRRRRHNSPDASPPRRRRHDSPDASPPRRRRHDSSSASPPHRAQAQQNDSDASLPRRRPAAEASPDPSPPRRSQAAVAAGVDQDVRKAEVMQSGANAGLVRGRELKEQLLRKQQADKERFARLDADKTGRSAKTVYRDKEKGTRLEGGAEELKALQDAKKPKHEKPAWGGGIAQMREREQQQEELRQQAARPFARTADDADRDMGLRERVRFGDPFAGKLARSRPAALPAPIVPAHMRKQMKKSGFVVPHEVPPHSWLKRRMGPPMNRYNIRPGRHWDGVDRSNGFEANMFKTRNELAARGDTAHMWAQQDM